MNKIYFKTNAIDYAGIIIGSLLLCYFIIIPNEFIPPEPIGTIDIAKELPKEIITIEVHISGYLEGHEGVTILEGLPEKNVSSYTLNSGPDIRKYMNGKWPEVTFDKYAYYRSINKCLN